MPLEMFPPRIAGLSVDHVRVVRLLSAQRGASANLAISRHPTESITGLNMAVRKVVGGLDDHASRRKRTRNTNSCLLDKTVSADKSD